MTSTDTIPCMEPAVPTTAGTAVDIVIPVYNEQKDLPRAITRLHQFLSVGFPWRASITIADNASTDDTWTIALRQVSRYPEVRAVHLDEKGRGHALKRTWMDSHSAVLCYMDVDLSTDLRALAPLVAPLLSGHSDLAIGTRLARSSRVGRGTCQPLACDQVHGALLARGARPETRVHLPLVQFASAWRLGSVLFRRSMRFQGHPLRCGPRFAAVRRRR